jgi:hypothetical protein
VPTREPFNAILKARLHIATYAGDAFSQRFRRDAVDGRHLLAAGSPYAGVKGHGRLSVQTHRIRNLEIEVLLQPLERKAASAP